MKKLFLILLIPLIFCIFPSSVFCSDEYVPSSDDVAKFLLATAYSTGCEYSLVNSDYDYLSNYLNSAYQNSDLDLSNQISSFVSGGSVFLTSEEVNNIWSFLSDSQNNNSFTNSASPSNDYSLYLDDIPIICCYGDAIKYLSLFDVSALPINSSIIIYNSVLPNLQIKISNSSINIKTYKYSVDGGISFSSFTGDSGSYFGITFIRRHYGGNEYYYSLTLYSYPNSTTGANRAFEYNIDGSSRNSWSPYIPGIERLISLYENGSVTPFSLNSFSGGGSRGGGAGRSTGITIEPQVPISDTPVTYFIEHPETIIRYVETTNEVFHLTISQPPYNVSYDEIPSESDVSFDGIRLFYGSNLTSDVEVSIDDCTIDYSGLNQSYVDIEYNNAVARLYLNVSGTETSGNNIFYLIWQAIKGIFDFIKSLFTFDSSIITDFKTANMPKILWIQDVTTYFNDFGSSLISGDAPIIYANLGDSESFNIGGNVEFINMAWYSRYKPIGDVIIGGFLWIVFIWNVYKHLPSILNGVSSSVDTFRGGE